MKSVIIGLLVAGFIANTANAQDGGVGGLMRGDAYRSPPPGGFQSPPSGFQPSPGGYQQPPGIQMPQPTYGPSYGGSSGPYGGSSGPYGGSSNPQSYDPYRLR